MCPGSCYCTGKISRRGKEAAKNGKYWEAQNLVQNKMLSEKYNESYISAGFLDCFLKNTEETKSYTRIEYEYSVC